MFVFHTLLKYTTSATKNKCKNREVHDIIFDISSERSFFFNFIYFTTTDIQALQLVLMLLVGRDLGVSGL